MSCENCNEFQDTQMTSFYRWKTANVEMRGCQEHLREVFEALNETQKNQEEIKKIKE